jgi:hypothetical protein
MILYVSLECCHSLELPFGRHRFGQTRCRIYIEVSVRCLHLIFPSNVGIPHSQVPVLIPSGARSLSFPTASVVPTTFYRGLLSLARLHTLSGNAFAFRLRARSYFSRWRVRLRTSVRFPRQPCALFSPIHRLSRLRFQFYSAVLAFHVLEAG